MKTPKKKWTLAKFFEQWYVNEATTTLSRKRCASKTIRSRRVGVRYWSELMATDGRPEGPKLKEITQEHLATFWDLLGESTFQRTEGGQSYHLAPASRYARFQGVVIVLAAAGPISGNKIRAGVLDSVPSLYVKAPEQFPKETWTLDEIRQVTAAIDEFNPPSVTDVESYRANLKAWMALCYHTGHRASTYQRIGSEDLREIRDGFWVLDIKKSVKTGKAARVPLHRHLLTLLQELGEGSPMIHFPVSYRTLFNHFKELQRFAGLKESRVFGPQAFRRLHCQTLIGLGVDQAQQLGTGSLGHSSSEVTKSHYGDATSLMIPTMPAIFELDNHVCDSQMESVS